MNKHYPKNERIKREYLTWQREAKRQSEASVDAVAAALARFEAFTRWRDFKSFHYLQAVAFKRHLAEQNSKVTGEKLSKSTQHSTLNHLRQFFQWLAGQPGYRSSITYSDTEYFSFPNKEARVATARRERAGPELEQVLHVIRSMPHASDVERRDRALVAFILLTGARDSAVASLKLKHVDLANRCVHQDARDVKTKFSKTFDSYFFPVGEEVLHIVEEWIGYLRTEKLWGAEDPLFPRTRVVLDGNTLFAPDGLDRLHWSNASPIRKVFRQAFESAGLPYANPHSLRKTLASIGQRLCRTAEQWKAWSQNFGHESVITTFNSYGTVATARQGEILRDLGRPRERKSTTKKVLQELTALLQQDEDGFEQ